MEGVQTPIKLTPYFRLDVPWGTSGRRLTRHDFLNNRWGLQNYHSPLPMPVSHGGGLGSGVPSDLHATIQKAVSSATVLSAEAAQSVVSQNFQVLRNDVQDVRSRMRRVEIAADGLARQLDVIIKQTAGLSTRRMSTLAEEEKEKLQQAHLQDLKQWEAAHEKQRVEYEHLVAEHEKLVKKLQSRERDMAVVLEHSRIDGLELEKAQEKIEDLIRQRESAAADFVGLPDERSLCWAFRNLRDLVSGFAQEVADRSGPLPKDLEVADSLFDPVHWNRAVKHQRMYRVMAMIFHVLFRRILRPSLRAFGVQTFLRTEEHHTISAAEATLRALERDLEREEVSHEVLGRWINATIMAAKPLRAVRQNVEGVTQEILDGLSPLIQHKFIRNIEQAREKVLHICEQAVNLKLALRQHWGGRKYKVEVPSRDVKQWGQPGYDELTRALVPMDWLRVVDQEIVLDREEKQGTSDEFKDVTVISFGSFSKIEEVGGDHRKIILEPGWVVAKSGKKETKRKSPTFEAKDYEETTKTPTRQRGVSPRQVAKIKALMGQEENEDYKA